MLEFVIIVESEADYRIASELAQRVIIEQLPWLEEHLVETFQWSGLQASTLFSCWRDLDKIKQEAVARGIHLPRFLGHKQPQSLRADGASALKALTLLTQLQRHEQRNIRAVVFIRDLDDEPERRTGLEQARAEYHQRTPQLAIVIGTADSKREAWVLNGFIPLTEHEQTILTELHRQLHFDPTTEAHRLRATTLQEPERLRNAKVVLSRLTAESHERERECWQTTPLMHLRERGAQTGLTTYLDEVQKRLTPLIRSA